MTKKIAPFTVCFQVVYIKKNVQIISYILEYISLAGVK